MNTYIGIFETKTIDVHPSKNSTIKVPDGLGAMELIDVMNYQPGVISLVSKFGTIELQKISNAQLQIETNYSYECSSLGEEIEFDMVKVATKQIIDEIVELMIPID